MLHLRLLQNSTVPWLRAYPTHADYNTAGAATRGYQCNGSLTCRSEDYSLCVFSLRLGIELDAVLISSPSTLSLLVLSTIAPLSSVVIPTCPQRASSGHDPFPSFAMNSVLTRSTPNHVPSRLWIVDKPVSVRPSSITLGSWKLHEANRLEPIEES